MMTGTELDELAADIKANGLVDPLVIWVDNHEAANGSQGPFPSSFSTVAIVGTPCNALVLKTRSKSPAPA